ncbi:bifunctional phosphoribosylaminoimidazolecarboxamide formyltransferase/IMP cyclohydrolase [Peptococcus simiae]|uniref:Bifunctional purine biosynthesis protein PurH n=1 Tax=Peptococcus simiae TaxID=1643805 RepID=A0ABW9H362_9FIRM
MSYALLSVSDKTNLVPFAKGLIRNGFSLLSTGGTYRTLLEAGLEVKAVEDVTGFPEMLDGRVKTLHPVIHAGILAKETPEHFAEITRQHIQAIDMVVVNLYPFRETIANPDVSLEEAIENIDIGGPTMLRAAAKNHERVTVVVDPRQYKPILEALQAHGEVPLDMRQKLALAAFQHTAVYDSSISAFLSQTFGEGAFPEEFALGGQRKMTLRYGENPHQEAAFYVADPKPGSIANAKQHQGKALSYNNIVDLDAAWQLVNEFTDTAACAIIKHTNPCGLATGAGVKEAYTRALAADPVSAYGGIIAFNQAVDGPTAQQITETFMEAVIAPSFTEEALEAFKVKDKLRLLETGVAKADAAQWVERVGGGFLVQSRDVQPINPADFKCVTKTKPTEAQMQDLLFAWKAVKHVKSNAIVVAKDGQTLGVGAGQMNRVGSCKIAFTEAGSEAKGAVLASDAFFPFRDSIDEAAKAGVVAVIQPGGSIRDEESIAACDEAGIAMIFTGVRHFRH